MLDYDVFVVEQNSLGTFLMQSYPMLLEVFHVEHPVWGFAIGYYVLAPMVVVESFVLSYGY